MNNYKIHTPEGSRNLKAHVEDADSQPKVILVESCFGLGIGLNVI